MNKNVAVTALRMTNRHLRYSKFQKKAAIQITKQLYDKLDTLSKDFSINLNVIANLVLETGLQETERLKISLEDLKNNKENKP